MPTRQPATSRTWCSSTSSATLIREPDRRPGVQPARRSPGSAAPGGVHRLGGRTVRPGVRCGVHVCRPVGVAGAWLLVARLHRCVAVRGRQRVVGEGRGRRRHRRRRAAVAALARLRLRHGARAPRSALVAGARLATHDRRGDGGRHGQRRPRRAQVRLPLGWLRGVRGMERLHRRRRSPRVDGRGGAHQTPGHRRHDPGRLPGADPASSGRPRAARRGALPAQRSPWC